MGKVLAGITISLDGYITGPNDGPGAGLGEGGERLHYWVFGGPWRYDGERVRMLTLAGDSYVEHEQSLAFPALRSAHLDELLAASQQMLRTAWLRHVRAWAQRQLGASH